MEEFLKDFTLQIAFIIICFAIILIATFLDLNCGIKKAKKRGEFVSSYKMRRTLDKLRLYLSVTLIAVMIDIAQMFFVYIHNQQTNGSLWWMLPIATGLVSLFIVFLEGKSIKEKAEKKEQKEAQEGFEMILRIAKALSSDDFAKLIDNIKNLKGNKNENNEGIKEQ